MGHSVTRNGASRAAVPQCGSRQIARRTVATMVAVLVPLSIVGCDYQQVSIREAYQIPQPQGALLQQHAKPRCDFGAPSQLPANAGDTWTPYSGQPDTRPQSETPPPAPADHANTYALLAKERDCYRQAEANVRTKLHRLQTSVDNTMTALQQETRHRVRARQTGRLSTTTQSQ